MKNFLENTIYLLIAIVFVCLVITYLYSPIILRYTHNDKNLLFLFFVTIPTTFLFLNKICKK